MQPFKKKKKSTNDRKKLPRFEDVRGNEEAKEELKDLVDYLQNPGKFTVMGAKIPKGVLLTGLPGCGKTLLGKKKKTE